MFLFKRMLGEKGLSLGLKKKVCVFAEISRWPLCSCSHSLNYISPDKLIFSHSNEQINKG